MRYLLLLALVFVAACDCDVCDDRSGVYIVQQTETSGTCGAVPNFAVRVNATYTLPPSCTGGSTQSEDNCTVDLDVTCTNSDGTSQRQRGTFEWDCDGDEAEGTLETSELAADGTQNCASVYTVSYTRSE